MKTNPPLRILVVDDDTDTRELNFEVLIRSGYQVDTAKDGEAAWQMLDAVRHTPAGYDLLITDNKMPKLSGVELIQKVRSAPMTLPVILASGTAPLNTVSLQLAAILPKPFSPDQLVETVKDVLHTANGDRGGPDVLKPWGVAWGMILARRAGEMSSGARKLAANQN
jgi:DNA-binding response OmpR family regulator